MISFDFFLNLYKKHKEAHTISALNLASVEVVNRRIHMVEVYQAVVRHSTIVFNDKFE
jgi:hypothetical protein